MPEDASHEEIQAARKKYSDAGMVWRIDRDELDDSGKTWKHICESESGPVRIDHGSGNEPPGMGPVREIALEDTGGVMMGQCPNCKDVGLVNK